MARKASPKAEQVVEINEISMKDVHFNILGTTPMIMHRFAQKAWRELLLPSLKENRASLEQKLKHEPYEEFRGGTYRNRNPRSPTLFHLPNGSFHNSLAAAALDMPGAKRTQIERLTKVVDVNIDLYGVPQIFCSMVRNSDQNRTPDVRTRPIFPEWACSITVQFLANSLTERGVTHLLAAAGALIGIGDWRSQKGGPYGAFKLVSDNDKQFRSIVKSQGRKAQQKAYDNPVAFDEDSDELLRWFADEVRRREMEGHLGEKTRGRGRGRPSARRRLPGNGRVIVEHGGNGLDAGDYVEVA